MGKIKKLAGQTAVYGLGTIVPRVLNYLLLTPFYTYLFAEGKYGIITELYAYIAFLLVILTYGMETTFFRFSESENEKDKVFSTSIISVFFTSLFFLIVVLIFQNSISKFIRYPENPEYVIWIAVIVIFDAISAIPFARLRKQNKAIKFVSIKIVNVLINIGLNLLFFIYCPYIIKENPESIFNLIYSEEIGVGYAFISNIVSSIITMLILVPDVLKIRFVFDKVLHRKMIKYTMPLLVVGIAGMINEVADKIFLKYLVSVPEDVVDKNNFVLSQIGIYGANYKIAVLMSIFIQMFRFAAEPFFFSQAKEKDSKKTYSDVMKYFVIFGLIIFLGVTLYIDIFKHFVGPNYRVGLHIVPVVLIANLFLGITFNLSIWYKLNNLTKYGAIIAIGGAIITIVLNLVLIPFFGYTGSAWATLICYFLMMYISFVLGQKFFPINYNIKHLFKYFVIAISFYLIHLLVKENIYLNYLVATLLLIAFLSIIYFLERKNINSNI